MCFLAVVAIIFIAMKTANQKSRIREMLQIYDCGLTDYREILSLQRRLCEQRQAGEVPDTVLIVEHPPVITLGVRQAANKLLVEPEVLMQRGIDLVVIRRGGGATAHNPSQLVFYPIVDLRGIGLGVGEYVRRLESIGIEFLAELGVGGERRKGFPGLWVEGKKIASIGVQVVRGVSFHGMAINIQNDLSIFDLIVPCGLDGVAMTSVFAETGKENSMAEIKERLVWILAGQLSCDGRFEYKIWT